jgi:hypothetical protein
LYGGRKGENIIGIRRYLIFQHQINYSAVHKIMIAIFAAPHNAELYTIVERPNVFSYNDLRSAIEILNCGNLLDEERYGSFYKVGLCSFISGFGNS